MANKKPVLGVVPCTKSGCSGEMVVRSRNAGRGGGTKKYGHCSTCKHLEQKNEFQEHLSSYRQDNPVKPPEAAPVVKKETPAPGALGEFDPVEITHLAGNETQAPKPGKARNGGGLRWLVGVVAIVGIVTGVGYAVNR